MGSSVLRDSPGAYIQGRYGFALANASAGDLWLKNTNGVIMRVGRQAPGFDVEPLR
jgi:hypothetical protein